MLPLGFRNQGNQVFHITLAQEHDNKKHRIGRQNSDCTSIDWSFGGRAKKLEYRKVSLSFIYPPLIAT